MVPTLWKFFFFEKIIILNLFYLRMFRAPRCCRNSCLRVCGVVPWLGIVRNIILLHTYFLNISLTNNFSLHTTPLHTWPVLKNVLFIRGNLWVRTAGRLINGCWALRLQVWHPCFFALAVLNPFEYLVWGQEPGSLTHTHHIQLPEERLFTRLEQVAKQDNALFMARLFTDKPLHYYTSTLRIYNPSGICLWGFSILL
jgi:hypothetical protein